MVSKENHSLFIFQPGSSGFPALHCIEGDDLVLFLDEEADSDESLPPKSQEPWRILIVDDEPQVHEATLLALGGSSFGDRTCSFLHAYSAAEALDLIFLHPKIDLVLLDVVMETRDAGLKLARHLRNENIQPDMKIVIRSGQPGWESDAQVSREYPVDGYIQKAQQTHRLLTDTLSFLLLGEAQHRNGGLSS